MYSFFKSEFAFHCRSSSLNITACTFYSLSSPARWLCSTIIASQILSDAARVDLSLVNSLSAYGWRSFRCLLPLNSSLILAQASPLALVHGPSPLACFCTLQREQLLDQGNKALIFISLLRDPYQYGASISEQYIIPIFIETKAEAYIVPSFIQPLPPFIQTPHHSNIAVIKEYIARITLPQIMVSLSH